MLQLHPKIDMQSVVFITRRNIKNPSNNVISNVVMLSLSDVKGSRSAREYMMVGFNARVWQVSNEDAAPNAIM